MPLSASEKTGELGLNRNLNHLYMKNSIITPQEKQRIILNIITDSIILDRVYRATNDLIQAASGESSNGWQAVEIFSGFTNAFHLFDIPLGVYPTGELGDLYYNIFDEDYERKGEREDAELLAKKIILTWKHFIKKRRLENNY